jgi:SAM-dependent methyltransferase
MSARRKKEWFDNEAFWADLYPFVFSEKRFEDASEQAEKILELARPAGNSVLDLCCGPGRFSTVLAKKGFAVTGVDRTRFLLNKAKERAKAAKAKVEWVQQDMRDFVRPRAFDLAINTFTSFGYFDDRREDIQVLENVFVSLKPGGVFLLDVNGKERMAKIFLPTDSEELPDGTLVVTRHQVREDWTRVRNEWILIRKGRAKIFKFHLNIYSGLELKERLELAGFSDMKLYGNFDGDEYGPEAQRLIAVARKA